MLISPMLIPLQTDPYPSMSTPTDNENTVNCDVLVIGAGLAGLSTALSLPKHLQITVLAKEDLMACSSSYAQGGIAAVIKQDGHNPKPKSNRVSSFDDIDNITNQADSVNEHLADSVNEHLNDTLIAGDGLCDTLASNAILSQGDNAIQWLVEQGVPFTLTDTEFNHGTSFNNSFNNSLNNKVDNSFNNKIDNKIDNKVDNSFNNKIDNKIDSKANNKRLTQLHLTQEGGHSRRRVVHADDATGKHIMQTLHEQVSKASHITVLLYHEAIELLTQKTRAVNTEDMTVFCTGAVVVDSVYNRLLTIRANAVVLASGGLGKLFDRATAPDVCMGDGMMMAWEAGCRLANLEFVQFHPTGLVAGNSNFLISEAVRGEGGYLLCPISRKRFMLDIDVRAELAPRDIVARAIAAQIAKNGLGYVHLDITHQPPAFIEQHFPDIYAHCLSVGIDMTCEPIRVAPTAHYTCGGVVTTVEGLTDIAGLYAAGEVAHTGLHGANRLASNSLLECVVVGKKIANHIPIYLDYKNNRVIDFVWHKPVIGQSLPIKYSLPIDADSVANVDATVPTRQKLYTNTNVVNNSIINELKQLMTSHMGIRRSQDQLTEALQQVTDWQQDNLTYYAKQSLVEHENLNINSLETYRVKRLLTLASLMLQSALARTESRGGHYRNDYTQTSDNPSVSIVYPSHASLASQPSQNYRTKSTSCLGVEIA